MSPPPDDLDKIVAAELAEALGQQDSLEVQAAAYATRKQAWDRSAIALIITLTFVAAIVALFSFVITASWGDPWEPPARFLLGLLSSVLLPVVTLVLGYYFGTLKKN